MVDLELQKTISLLRGFKLSLILYLYHFRTIWDVFLWLEVLGNNNARVVRMGDLGSPNHLAGRLPQGSTYLSIFQETEWVVNLSGTIRLISPSLLVFHGISFL